MLSPGWIGVVVVLSAASMTYGNFAALAQRNLKRMLAYSSIAHAGYMLVGVAAAGVSTRRQEAAGSVLFYLVVYAFSNIGAFAVAAWLARDKGSDDIDDLNGLGFRYPGLATCILLLMLSLIGMPPLAGFFGKLYMFMEALDESQARASRLTLMWLVGAGPAQQRGLGVLLRARAQGDVPPRPGPGGARARRVVAGGPDRAGDGGRHRLRALPHPAAEPDEGGRGADDRGERPDPGRRPAPVAGRARPRERARHAEARTCRRAVEGGTVQPPPPTPVPAPNS